MSALRENKAMSAFKAYKAPKVRKAHREREAFPVMTELTARPEKVSGGEVYGTSTLIMKSMT